MIHHDHVVLFFGESCLDFGWQNTRQSPTIRKNGKKVYRHSIHNDRINAASCRDEWTNQKIIEQRNIFRFLFYAIIIVTSAWFSVDFAADKTKQEFLFVIQHNILNILELSTVMQLHIHIISYDRVTWNFKKFPQLSGTWSWCPNRSKPEFYRTKNWKLRHLT